MTSYADKTLDLVHAKVAIALAAMLSHPDYNPAVSGPAIKKSMDKVLDDPMFQLLAKLSGADRDLKAEANALLQAAFGFTEKATPEDAGKPSLEDVLAELPAVVSSLADGIGRKLTDDEVELLRSTMVETYHSGEVKAVRVGSLVLMIGLKSKVSAEQFSKVVEDQLPGVLAEALLDTLKPEGRA